MVRVKKLPIVFVVMVIVIVTVFKIYYHPIDAPDEAFQRPTRGKRKILKRQGPPKSVVEGYCNFPESIVIGAEGLPPTDYRLVSVVSLVRHGNRLPMTSTPPLGPLTAPEVSCVLNASTSSMPQSLQAFIDKTSELNGQAALWPFKLRPQSLYCRSADLTQIGVEQHIKTGQILREAYRGQLEISQKNIRVISTVRSRTYHSAIAFVYGILSQEVDFSTLEIKGTASTEFCRREKPSDCSCPKADELLADGEFDLRMLKRSDKLFQKFNSSLHRALGDEYRVRSYYPWKTAHDMMISWLCRREPLPCDDDDVCFKESQADKNWQSLSFYYQTMSENEAMIESAKLRMYHMLQEIVLRLSRHSSQTSLIEDTFTVYSGHDNTLTPLMLALELPIKQWPPFAARLVFELYKPMAGSFATDYLFKLIYNGEDVTKQLKFCVSNNVRFTKTGCALKDLINFYSNMLPQAAEDCKKQA